MSIKKIIQEASSKNALGFEAALKEELRARMSLALEAKMKKDEKDEKDEEDGYHPDEDSDDSVKEELELDEAKSFHAVLKAHGYKKQNGSTYRGIGGGRAIVDTDHVTTRDDVDGIKKYSSAAGLNRYLNGLHDHDISIKDIKDTN